MIHGFAFSNFAYLPPAAVLLLFFVLHLALSALPRKPGRAAVPLLWRIMEKAAEAYEFRLNRGGEALILRGSVVAVFLGLAGLALGLLIWRVAHYPFGWVAQLALLLGALSVLGPLRLLRDVAAAVEKNDGMRAAALLLPHVDDDLAAADMYKLCRAALEFGAAGFNRYFIAPAFYYMLLGPAGLCVYVGLLSHFGAAARAGAFGAPARRIEAIADFIPARLAALLLTLAAVATPQANPLAAFGVALRQSSRFTPVNCGWTIGALAGALGITLGGPQRLRHGGALYNGWLGPKDSSARLSAIAVKDGAMLIFVGFLCAMALWTAAFMAIYKLS